MKKLSEMPFISISKENLMAASDMLDREQMGELMEMIADAILNDAYPTSDDRCVNGVYKQFMAVIERKAEGYAKRVANLDKVNQEKKKQTKTEQKEEEVSVYTDKTYNNLSDKAKQFIKYCGEDWSKIEQLSKKIWEKDDYDKDLNNELNTLVSKYAEPFGMADDSDEWEELKTYLFIKA